MRNRLLSLLLVVLMLFSIVVSTVSCAQLEQFVGYENLGDDYINKYYPNGLPGTGDSGNDGGNTGDGGSTRQNQNDRQNSGHREAALRALMLGHG